jgi:hypothetical protein
LRGEGLRRIAGLIFIGGIILYGTASLAGVGVNLTVMPTSLSFADTDPDFISSIPANTTIQVFVKVTGNPQGSWTLTHRAATDLRSGADIIPINSITWTASPNPPFLNGTMSALADQRAGGDSGNANIVGTFRFSLRNSWDYNRGNYSTITTFTLSAP